MTPDNRGTTRIGVDTGGTFTDLVALGPEGVAVHKVRSTPDDPSRAILGGIRELVGPPSGFDVVHGSTVATNAVLERRGARVALLATSGFEDVLRIGRQTRRELYNFMVEDRRPLVEAGLTFGVTERLSADGAVLVPLDIAALEDLADRVRRAGANSIAICFLHSYRNPAHERQALDILNRTGLDVSASHLVLREYREFERWSTTVVNAYVTPLMSNYLGALEADLGNSRLSIMQSNGGSISAATARAAAVRTILSGPAAGVVGARAVAEMAGYGRIITFDMGGTSTDVSLVDGEIGMTTESTVGDFPVRLPVIDIHTVGAGGGSIAYVDAGGALRVGPRSAGADPGPVCYGKGTEPTVSDANLLLGRMDPAYFLGGRMALDMERARGAVRGLADTFELDALEVAEGVVRVANANMERAIRVVSVQRGFDPREFALLAFGGAGGMHACEIAATLDIATVIVPRYAGVLSALGMLLADVTKDYSLTVLREGEEARPEAIATLLVPLAEQAERELRAEGFSPADIRITRSVDVRYIGQSYEITVPFGPRYRDDFDAQHLRMYGYANPERRIEVVNVRVGGIGVSRKPQLPSRPVEEPIAPEPNHVARAQFGGRQLATAFFRWESLEPGSVAEGPAVVAGRHATAVVPPGFSFRIDDFGNLVALRAAVRSVARRRPRAIAGAR